MSLCVDVQHEGDAREAIGSGNNEMEAQDEHGDGKDDSEAFNDKQQLSDEVGDGDVVDPAISNPREDDEMADPAISHPSEEEDNEMDIEEITRPRLRVIAPTIRTSVPLSAQVKAVSALHEEFHQHPGFGIESGTLELVKVARKEWSHPQQLPLPIASPKTAPIIKEFTRPWSALRLRSHPSESLPRGKVEMTQDQSLLKNYEPRFSVGEQTFPSEIAMPTFFDPRVAVEDAHAFLVAVHLRFTLGMVRSSARLLNEAQTYGSSADDICLL